MDLDAMTAVGIIVAGYGIGYGAEAFNQYTVVVAQDVAGVPTYSGWQVRMGILIPFALIGAHHVHSYAKRVKRNPSLSLLMGVEPLPGASESATREYPALTVTHLLIILSFFLALGIAVWGIATQEIGRASCMERVWWWLVVRGGAGR